MENWQLALVTMAALVAGAAIPLLFQLRATLREISKKVTSVEESLQPTLEDARIAVHRIRLVTDAVEGDEANFGRNFNELVDSASELAATLRGLGNSAKVATAVGSAVAAGVRAFRDSPRQGQAQQEPFAQQQEPFAQQQQPMAQQQEPFAQQQEPMAHPPTQNQAPSHLL
jgi:ABC-type transporter Mla subunit MlaD